MGYKGRGLHKVEFLKSFTKGNLKCLLDIVKNDDTLVFQIRNNYVNIYYNGGNLVKIEDKKGTISFDFDEGYFNQGQKTPKKKESLLKKKESLLKILESEKPDYQYFVDEMKSNMDSFWNWLENREENPRDLSEKNEQHSLCVNNTESDEFTVIDLEFQVSNSSNYKYEKPEKQRKDVNEKKKSPRFDIIAVRNSDKQLCVIELKCGTGALFGKSGLGDHADSFEGTIKRNEEAFKKEIRKIIEDKIALGLLSKGFSIKDNSPEFMFAFVAKEKDVDRFGVERNEEEQKKCLETEMKNQECRDYKVMFLKKDGNYRLCEPVNINDL